MNKITRTKNEDFTVISNVFLRDKNLSIKAKGFLAVIMGLPSNWDFTVNGVCAILKEGKTAIYNVIEELKEHGYCSIATIRDDKGRIMGNDYTFYEEPYIEKPHTENLNMDNQHMGEQPQLNIDCINNIHKKEKKEINKSIPDKDEAFEQCWIAYRRKGSKAKSKQQWNKLTDDEKGMIAEHIKHYVESISDIKFQKDFERYLKDKMFLNVVYKNNMTLFDPDDNNETTTDNDTLIINGVFYK